MHDSDLLIGKHGGLCKKAERHYLKQCLKRATEAQEDALIDNHITLSEDERTALAKLENMSHKCISIDRAHDIRRTDLPPC